MKRITFSGGDRATASSELLAALSIYSREMGIGIEGLCSGLGLERDSVANSGGRVSIDDFLMLWKRVMEESGDANFGLHIAASARKLQGQNSILYSILRNCATLGQAIDKLIAYHDMTTTLIRIELARSGGSARLSWRMREEGSFAEDRHYSEGVMAILAFILSDLSEGGIALTEVNFTHPMPTGIEEHTRLFGRAPRFGEPRNELAFDEKLLSLPIIRANSELRGILERYAARLLDRLNAAGPYAPRTTQLISSMLSRGERPSVESVAGELGLSVRNLQIKLKEEKCSYQAVLDGMRKEIALEYLGRAETPLSELAFLLGFSEQSSFSRAFRRWTGSSPREYSEAVSRLRPGSGDAPGSLEHENPEPCPESKRSGSPDASLDAEEPLY